jgi:hypothetical protein
VCPHEILAEFFLQLFSMLILQQISHLWNKMPPTPPKKASFDLLGGGDCSVDGDFWGEVHAPLDLSFKSFNLFQSVIIQQMPLI